MKLGQTLLVLLPTASNGSPVAPALVTRVWGPSMVNLCAFPDVSTPVVMTSVRVFLTEDEARASGQTPCAWVDA